MSLHLLEMMKNFYGDFHPVVEDVVLCEIGAKVFTIERIKELYRKTSSFFDFFLEVSSR